MSLQEIKAAAQQLSLEERAQVAACLHVWNDDGWDEQMKRDLASGKLNKILAQVDEDIADNKLRGRPSFRGPTRHIGNVSTASRRTSNGSLKKSIGYGNRTVFIHRSISNR
jgi:hypothetical protein